MAFFEVVCGFVIFLFLLYRYLIATYNFWKERNVSGPDPKLIFGTMKAVILKKEFCGIYWKHMYDIYKDAQFVGLFKMREPILMIKDPKHIKDIFQRFFIIFNSRNSLLSKHPIQRFLFFMDGPIAHLFRSKMSSAFTPSKIKEVFATIQKSFVRFENYMNTLLLKSDCVNGSDVITRLTIDIISHSLMGIDLKILSTETSKVNNFLNYAEIYRGTKGKNQMIKKVFSTMLPQLYDLVGYRLFQNDKITNFYTNFIFDLMEYRKKNNIVKSGFIGLLMELRDNPNKLNELIDMTNHFYGAQIFGFFYAGFETSATTITNTLYELAWNQNIQDKLRNEIQNFYTENGEFTYDNINSLSYLNAVFKETLRKYPTADSILRRSSSSYTFKDTEITIPKGQTVLIPVYAIHHDAKIYPKPEVYDPERFSDEVVRSRDPMHYIPFGYGIRNCIDKRLGILQTKVGVVAFLRKYKIYVCEKTMSSYKYHSMPLTLLPADPIYFKVTKIDSDIYTKI